MSTFPETLRRALQQDPSRPFVTFYDEATGERQELSLTTYANWVAKASSLLAEEHDLERGQTLRIDLPAHWLATVFLGAAWNLGLVVTDADDPDAVVCGPATLARWQDLAAGPVLACSLLPFGVRFADPLPAGVHDVGIEIWGQPDAFTPWDPPAEDDPATSWEKTETTQGVLLAPSTGHRVLTTVPPATPDGSLLLAGLLASDGSVVLVTNADAPERLAKLAETEQASNS